jgi:hypothetical protein
MKNENVVTLQPRFPLPRRLVLQKTLQGIFESQRLLDEAKAQVLKELDAGAKIEPGKRHARINRVYQDGKLILELKVR